MSDNLSSLAEQFHALFTGLERAYGTYNGINQTRDNGKRTGTAVTIRQPVTDELWAQHLAGQNGLGIVPLRDNSTCVFGAIDIDVYDSLDLGAVAAKVAKMELPLISCRSKSGGLHLYLFASEPVDAGVMQDRLRDMAAKLGHGGAEIFPKQRKLMPKECGGWINVPYFDHEKTNRYAMLANREQLSAEQFLALAQLKKVGSEFFETPANKNQTALPDGPPCLQYLVTLGFPEGTRNNALTNLGIYAKHVNPDTFPSDVENFNRGYMQSPLSSQEVSSIIKSLTKKDYRYTCSKDPLMPYCNSIVCRTRKYGIGGGTAASLPVLGALTKYDSNPPLYWWDVDGLRIELSDEEILDYRKFKRACFARLNKVLPHLTEKKWHELLRTSIETMTVESVPPDASPEGQFWELLEQFCNGRSQAQSRIELMGGNKPLTENNRTVFRLNSLMNFLDRMRFRHFNIQRVAAVLTSRGGEASKMTVQGKQLRVWSVPAFARAVEDAWPVSGDIGKPGEF